MNQAIESAALYFMNQGKFKIDAPYTPKEHVLSTHTERSDDFYAESDKYANG